MRWVGIDPDVEKSGYSIWESETKELTEVSTLSFFDVLEDLERGNFFFCTTVVVEAGWLIKKSNWHGGKNKNISARIGKNVGANHQTGKLIVEYCKRENINVIEVKPMGKKNAKQFKKITGWSKRTNSEMRDAAMLVYGR